ncbi:MAG: GGDEF domain-containing protein [Terracidiphilus sp.]
MKKLIPAIALVFSWAMAAWAGAPPTLTTLGAIHALTNEQAARALPVDFEATVTYNYGSMLFLQDGDAAIYAGSDKAGALIPGDRVRVRGTTGESFRPKVLVDSLTLLRHGEAPQPVPATFDELIRGQQDCRLVTVHAVVRSTGLESMMGKPVTDFQLNADGGSIEATVKGHQGNAPPDLLDAEVEVTGVVGGKFDGKMQMKGIALYVSSLANVKILKRAGASPWSQTITPMDAIFSVYHVQDVSQRVRVHGIITYYLPGSAVVLQNGEKSLWIMTRENARLQIGSEADATGFPDLRDGFLTLTNGEFKPSSVNAPIAPKPVTKRELTSSKNVFDLVSIEGEVVMEVREGLQDEYVLASDGLIFSAIYRHPDVEGLQPQPMNQVPLGSRVSITGICILESSNPFDSEVPFEILMRSPADIAVVAAPSLLSNRNLLILVGLLLGVVIVVGARGWYIERKIRRHTSAMAYVERRRSRILEDINGSRPLVEIVENITELVSFELQGAPCWCQIADGAQVGNYPPKLDRLRIVSHVVPARSGAPLGAVFAALDSLAKPRENASEALSSAAGLIALAVETRRLYSDLLHRSEFDMLTEIPNRFTLDKHLEAQIEAARLNAGIFGLIYIDLDCFKEVNDGYGHHIGDMVLQEAVQRMKHQLRSHDLLARLGGDEFAVLVPMVHNRADVEEIALRVERSFDEPFIVEEFELHSSASVGIAIYPQDGASKDSVLSAADAAMYEAKNTRKRIGQMLAAERPLDSRISAAKE